MLKGYAINQRLITMEERMDKRIGKIENTLVAHQEKIDFFVRTSLPPHQGIFYDGQIFDAYTFINDRIREATTRIILIDNYIDDSVLTMLAKRADKVTATIYTKKPSTQLQLDMQKHNAQYPPINVVEFNRSPTVSSASMRWSITSAPVSKTLAKSGSPSTAWRCPQPNYYRTYKPPPS